MRIYNYWIAKRFITHSVCIHSKLINRIYDKKSSWIARKSNQLIKSMIKNFHELLQD